MEITPLYTQFSAAIADTINCGGLLNEYSGDQISRNTAYLTISLGCIALVWTANVFEIITYAARMFAAYYFTQCLEALYANHVYRFKGKQWSLYFSFLAFIMWLIFFFGMPAK